MSTIFTALLLASAVETACLKHLSTPDWADLRQKHRGLSTESDVEGLWSFRLKLCVDAIEGRISYEEADERFERERRRLMDEWRGAGASESG